MPAITLLLTLCFSFFFLFEFSILFSFFFLFLCGVVMFTLSFLSYCSVVVPFPCARQKALLYCLSWRVFTILSLNCFCLGVGVLPNHPLVYQLPSHHHLPMLAMPHPITRQRVLFCLLAHCGIPIRRRVGILSHYPSRHAPSNSNSSFPLLGGMLSQQNISPKRV